MGVKSKTLKILKEKDKTFKENELLKNVGNNQIEKLNNMDFSLFENIVFGNMKQGLPVNEKLITEEMYTEFGYFCMKEQLYGIPTNETVDLINEVLKDYEKNEIVEIGAGNGWFAKILGIKGIDNYSQKIKTVAQDYLNMGQVPMQYTDPSIVKVDAITYLKRMKNIKVVFGSYITEVKYNVYGVDESKIFQNNVEKYLLLCSTTSHMNKTILTAPGYKRTILAENLLVKTGRNGFLVLIEKGEN